MWQKEDENVKKVETSEDEENFDKEALCFKYFKENIIHDLFISTDDSPLKISPEDTEGLNEKNTERNFLVANLVDMNEVNAKLLEEDLKGVDIQPSMGVFQLVNVISMYTPRIKQWTFHSIKMLNINYRALNFKMKEAMNELNCNTFKKTYPKNNNPTYIID